MIAWLAPVGALALVAAAPVVIHLLSHRPRTERSFPALALLHRTPGGRGRVGPLRQRLSLLARILALIALLLAVAMPVLRAGGAPGQGVVVIVDASASMRQLHGGTTAFTAAQGRAGRILDAVPDRPALVLVAGTPLGRSSLRPEADHGPARALLAEAAPGWGAGALEAAVAAGVEALGGGGDLWVVTDGGRTALAGVDPAALPAGITWHAVTVPAGGTNRAITAIAVEPGTAIAGRSVRLRIAVANYGPEARVTLHLTVGGTTRDHALTLPAGATVAVEHELTPTAPGTIPVEAALVSGNDGDVLPEDDVRHGVLEVLGGAPLRLYTDADPQDGAGPARPLLAAALAAGMAAEARPGRALAEDLAVADPRLLVATAGLAGDLPGAHAALLDHLRRGGRWLQVVVTDRDARLVAEGIDPPARPGAAVDLLGRARGLGLGRLALDHPLCIGLRGREPLLARLEGWRFRPAPPTAGSVVPLAWSDGSAALALRPVGPGWWVQLGISPADADSNLAALELLPLLIPHLPDLGGQDRLADAAVACGSTRRARAGQGPDGPQAVREGVLRLDRPGLWQVDGRPLAAAIPAGEADLTPVPVAEGGARAGDAAAQIAAASDRPLWPWALAAALALFITELLLAGGLPRRAT